MCDCITKTQESLTKLMVEKNPGCTVAEPVCFQNLTFVLGKHSMEVLSNPVMGRYIVKGKVKKWEISAMPIYCPYCGEKLFKEEA
jgi:uncharacterized protein (DUF779 family)